MACHLALIRQAMSVARPPHHGHIGHDVGGNEGPPTAWPPKLPQTVLSRPTLALDLPPKNWSTS